MLPTTFLGSLSAVASNVSRASGASITDHATEAGEQLDLFVLVDLVSEPSGQYGSGGKFDETERRYRVEVHPAGAGDLLLVTDDPGALIWTQPGRSSGAQFGVSERMHRGRPGG